MEQDRDPNCLFCKIEAGEIPSDRVEEDGVDGTALAQRACLSPYHFNRLVASRIGEPPVAFRRRLLLERAAYQLSATQAPVTDLAFDAGYGSLEAFTRAFRRAFGRAP